MVQADDLDILDPADWSAAAIQPDLWTEMPGEGLLTRLYAKFRTSLPATTSERLLVAKAWHDLLGSTEQNAHAPLMILEHCGLDSAVAARGVAQATDPIPSKIKGARTSPP